MHLWDENKKGIIHLYINQCKMKSLLKFVLCRYILIKNN
jgi:hypothetical protein